MDSDDTRLVRRAWSMVWLPLAALLLGLAPLVVLAVVAIRESTGSAREQAERGLVVTSDATAHALHEQLVGLADLVESYGNRNSIRAAVNDPLNLSVLDRALVEIRAVNPDVELAFVTDADGVLRTIAPYDPEVVGVSFDHRDWYRGALATGRGYVSEVYQTAAGNQGLVVTASAPVRAPDDPDRISGIIVVGLGIDSLQEFVEGFAEAQGVELTITDQRGTLVAAGGQAPDDLVSLTADQRVADGLAGGRGVGELEDPNGDRVVYAYTPVADIGWVVIAELPEDVAYDGVGEVSAGIIAATIAIAAIAAGGVVFVVMLQTRRRRSERRLAQSEAFLDSIIENIPNLVAVKDSQERFIRANLAAERIVGRNRDDLLGKTAFELFPLHEAELFSSRDRSVLETGEPTDNPRVELTTPAGERRLLHIKRLPISAPDTGERYVLVIAEDITERVAADERLVEAQQNAEQANQAKSEFISRMSHELRTPLNAVLGFAQLLEGDDLDVHQVEAVHQILHAGRHLLGLMNEILDTSLIEAGRIRITPEAVRLADVVDESLDLVRPLAQARDIRFPARHPVGSEHWVRCDRQRLKQVLVNLLTNAVKYNRDDGSVSVRGERVGTRVRLDVTDTGPGIPEEQLPLVFVPFERLGAERTVVEGTGLGLPLAKGLVEQMGGEIGVESVEGAGSTFWLELESSEPATDPELDAASDPDPLDDRNEPPTEVGVKRVLYIEDNPSNVRLVERILARETAVELLVAIDGGSGLAAARSESPDLVLLDLNLPDLGGEAVLAQLREHEATRDVPILMLSADATSAQITKLLEAGASGYVTKPFDILDFRRTLTEHLGVALGSPRSGGDSGPAPVGAGAPESETESESETETESEPADRLDPEIVDQLVEVFADRESADGFLDTIRTNFEARFADLSEAVGTHDTNLIRQHGHSLKGVAATVGLVRAATIGREIELSPTAGAERITELASQLRDVFEADYRLLAIRLRGE